MQQLQVELCIYQDARGRQRFADWFDSMADRGLQARVLQRLDRLQAGNPGDCRSLGNGLFELRIDTGPGYRIYFAGMGIGRFLILGGGSKRNQAADIERARKWLEDARKQHGR